MNRQPRMAAPCDNIFAGGPGGCSAALQAEQNRTRIGEMVLQGGHQRRAILHAKPVQRGGILIADLANIIGGKAGGRIKANQRTKSFVDAAHLRHTIPDEAPDDHGQNRKGCPRHHRNHANRRIRCQKTHADADQRHCKQHPNPRIKSTGRADYTAALGNCSCQMPSPPGIAMGLNDWLSVNWGLILAKKHLQIDHCSKLFALIPIKRSHHRHQAGSDGAATCAAIQENAAKIRRSDPDFRRPKANR